MSSSQPNPVLSQSAETVVIDVLKQAAERSPDHERALLLSAVPRWFDAEVVKGMFPPDEPPRVSTDEILLYLTALPFSELHPTRDNAWRFRGEYREQLLKQQAITEHRAELHSRAANLFKQRFDAKASVGEKKFEDRGLKDIAVEYVYHLQQLDTLNALKAVRGICAETLAVITSGRGRPEVVFCSRFLGALDWPTAPEAVEKDLNFLRAGVSALLTGNDIKALPMLSELVEFPGLDAEQRSALHRWIGEIHLWEEERLGPALDRFHWSLKLTPRDAVAHIRISEVYYTPGPLVGRFDLAEEYARETMKLAPVGEDGYLSIAGILALGDIAKLQGNNDAAIEWYDQVISSDPTTLNAYLSQSELYSAKGELNKALEKLDQALIASPDNEYYIVVRRGNAYRDARRYDAALQEYYRARDEAPDRIDAYIGIGGVQALLWNLEAAEESYRKALELKPDAANGYVELARLYEQQTKWGRAIDVCLDAKKRIDAKDLYIRLSDSYERLGQLEELRKIQEELVRFDSAEEYASHCALGDAWLAKAWRRGKDRLRERWLSEAQNEFGKALTYDPYRAWAHLSLARLAVLENDEHTIQEAKRRVIELAGWAHYDMLVSLGRAYLDNYQYAEAEQELLAAVELAPRRKPAWRALGDLYYQKSDVNGVIRAWSQLVDIDPDLTYDKHMRVGDAYYRDAKYDDALNEYTEARNLEPETYDAYWGLADIAELDQDWDQALANHDIVAITAPGLAAIACVRMVRIRIAQKRFPDAGELIQKAIDLDWEQPFPYIEFARLGVIDQREDFVTEGRELLASAAADKLYDFNNAIAEEYRQAQQYDKAEQLYKECLRQDPERVEAYIGLGQVRLDQDQPQRATEYLPQALIIDRTNFDAHLAVAEMYEKLDQLDLAQDALLTAVQLRPWQPDAYLYLGSLLHRRGDSEGARKNYQNARDAAGVNYLNLGASYELKRKLDDAIEVYRIGLEYEPADLQPDFHLALASLYGRTNNFDEAMKEYRQAINLDPTRPDAYQAQAEFLADNKQIIDALEVYDQMARQPGLAYSAQILRGMLFEKLEQYDDAVNSYRQAIALAPEIDRAYLDLTNLLTSQNRADEAIEVYRLMAQQPELTYSAHIRSGRFLAEQQQYDEAMKAYQQAIEADPGVAVAYLELADLYHQRARVGDAEQLLGEALKAVPDAGEVPFLLAQLKEEQAHSDEAIQLFRKAVELAPNADFVPQAHQHIGRLLIRSKQYDEAEKELVEAVTRNPANADAHYDLGDLYQQLGDDKRALESYRKVTTIAPKYRDAYVASLRIYANQKDTKNLALLEQQILELDLNREQKYDAHLIIGDAYLMANATDQAATHYRKALELDPGSQEAYVRLAQMLADEKRIDEALDVCRRMAQQPQLAYVAQVSIGNLMVAQEKYPEAAQAFQEAIQVNPEEAEPYLQLAVLQYRAGKFDETEKLISQALEKGPKNVEALRLMAEFREQMQQWEEALTFYRRVLELQPAGVAAAETYQKLALVLAELHRYDEAEKELEHAKENDPDNPAIYYKLGVVYELLGNVERAEESYLKATEIDRNYVNAYRALGHLYAQQADEKKLDELAKQILSLDLQPADRYQAQVLISTFYQDAHLYESGIEYLNQAAALDPKGIDAYSALGQIYEIQRDWSKAQAYYEKVAELEPELQTNMHLRIGYLFVAQEKPEDAEKEFSRINVEELKPDDQRIELLTAGYLGAASLYRKQDKPDAMKKACSEVISLVEKLHPTSQNVIRQLGLAYLMLGDSAAAGKVLRDVLEAQPTDAKAHLYLALTSLLEGDADKAQAEFKLGTENVEHEDDYIYAIEEAEVLAARAPEVAGATEMLQTLRDAQNRAR